MEELYRDLSKIYDKIGISEYSIIVGKSILKFFENEHPTEEFKENLDICCGTGALCNFFKENGIESKGVDMLEDMINIANENYPNIEFIQSDIVKYKTDKTFDFITCTDDALNHILDIEDFKATIKNVSSWLRDGGYFFFDLNLANIIPKYVVKGIDENSKLTYDHEIMNDEIYHYKIKFYRNEEVVWEHDFYERIYHAETVIEILNENGLILERCGQEFYEDLRHGKLKFIARKGEKNMSQNYIMSKD